MANLHEFAVDRQHNRSPVQGADLECNSSQRPNTASTTRLVIYCNETKVSSSLGSSLVIKPSQCDPVKIGGMTSWVTVARANLALFIGCP